MDEQAKINMQTLGALHAIVNVIGKALAEQFPPGQAGADAAQRWFADLKESVTLADGVAGHDLSAPQTVQHQAMLGVLTDIERRTRLEIAASRRLR